MEKILLVVLGGAITVAVQWFVTPRVQRAIRLHERRERSLLDLGRVLVEEMQPVCSRLRVSASILLTTREAIAARDVDRTSPNVQKLREQELAEIRAAGQDWRALRARIDWLAYLAGEHSTSAYRRFSMAAMRVPTTLVACDKVDADELDALWEEERDARDALVMQVRDQLRRTSSG